LPRDPALVSVYVLSEVKRTTRRVVTMFAFESLPSRVSSEKATAYSASTRV